MRSRYLFFAVAAILLVTAGCDAADVFGGGSDGSASPAVQVVEGAEPFIPNGWPRLIYDAGMLGLLYLSNRFRKKDLKDYDESEFTAEEAKSMRKALVLLQEEEAQDAADAEQLSLK